jgi:hypothetical protein
MALRSMRQTALRPLRHRSVVGTAHDRPGYLFVKPLRCKTSETNP